MSQLTTQVGGIVPAEALLDRRRMVARPEVSAPQRDEQARLRLVDKLYQRSIFDSVRRVAEGERLRAPIVVDLDPTTFCDLACPECISGKLLNKGRFDRARLVTLAAEFVSAGVRAVILIGGGEPLAHPATGEVIQRLGDGGLSVGIVTNGTNTHRYVDLIARYVDWVRVSVDAGTSETFQRFRPNRRGTSSFSRVIDNMRELATKKKGSLGYSFLLMSRFDSDGHLIASNYDDVYEAAALAKDIGCDYFELKAMFDLQHFIIEQPPHLIASLRHQLRSARTLEDHTFEVVHSSTLDALIEGRSAVQSKDYSRCRIAELRTLITPNGVFICPYHRGNPAAKLGDAVEEPFDELWRKADTTVIVPARDCQFHCARHESNLDLIQLATSGPSRTVEDDYDLFI